jgi:hypothetical protein
LSEDQVNALVAYIKSLSASPAGQPTKTASAASPQDSQEVKVQ